MIRRMVLAGLAALAVAACGDTPSEPSAAPSDDPLLWEIASADGGVEGWLYGTIHALPDGVGWRNRAIDDVVDAADYLIVEVAALEDGAAISREFARTAQSAGHPLLRERVRPSLHTDLATLVARTSYSPEDFQQIESWGAALILAQATRQGVDSANGVDKALIKAFRGRDIQEFEGAEKQFAIFDGLAEADQRALLEAVVEEGTGPQPSPPLAVQLWISGDADALEQETTRGILADPEVRQALLVDRNRDWLTALTPLLSEERLPLVAVGAAHLVGADGLVALLEAEGYTLRRLP